MSTFEDRLAHFLKLLEHFPQQSGVYNPYSPRHEESAIRLANLRLYLTQLFHQQAQILLVGEAPGHWGCRLTGIPFSSEKLLIEHPRFGTEKGYRLILEDAEVKSEATATMVHHCMDDLGLDAVCWNAFPFHPYPKRNPFKNRVPLKAEVQKGQVFLQQIISLFEISQVVAVGQVAGRCLTQAGINHEKVRHPSYGGKSDFEKGLKMLTRRKP